MTGDTDMAGDAQDLSALRARLESLRRRLGTHLAARRHAAGVSQGELADALGRTRSLVSKVEHGTRTMPEPLWEIADQTCRAEGVLIAEHAGLAQVERDYRRRWQAWHRVDQKTAARARAAAPVAGDLPALLCDPGDQLWRDEVLDGISGELSRELMAVIDRLARSVGRRRAMQLASWMLATVGLSDLDGDEQARVAHAVATPDRADAQVVQNLAATLAHCRRLDDKLGARAVLETVQAQHELVHHLLQADAEQSRQPLRVLDSITAAAIGNYLVEALPGAGSCPQGGSRRGARHVRCLRGCPPQLGGLAGW